MREITIRGMMIASLLAVLFTVANTYLGLKVGATFATSIPAAVIAMSVLTVFKDSSIKESNIIQTIASVGGALSSLVFILPAFVMLDFWHGFPFWQVFLIAMIGGTLGVFFTIPLRRALVVDSNLPYPEGRAAAETLKAGYQINTNVGQQLGNPLRDLTVASVIAFIFNLCSSGLRVLTVSASYYGKVAGLISGIGFQFSFALIGAGYLIGFEISLAILLGVIMAWGVAVPFLSLHSQVTATTSASHIALHIWLQKVRYIGCGTIGVASISATMRLIKPIFRAMRSTRHQSLEKQQRDIPVVWMMIAIMGLCLPLTILAGYFIHAVGVTVSWPILVAMAIFCTVLIIIIGFFSASISGYMAGLVGSSNSPISGVAILITILIALFFSFLFSQPVIFHLLKGVTPQKLTALVIFIVAVAFAAAVLANDNLQDLNTGYLVGATPWKQQLTLIWGVAIGSAVLPFILNQLYQAYGFPGSMPHTHMDPSQALSAPQAALISAITNGIIHHTLQWSMLILGVVIGVVLIMINCIVFLPRRWHPISVFCVGFGIYLPLEITLPLVLGGLLYGIVHKRLVNRAKYDKLVKRCALLLACGLIVGESLFGVFNAFMISVIGKERPLAIVGLHHDVAIKLLLTLIIFCLIMLGLYGYIKKTTFSSVQ